MEILSVCMYMIYLRNFTMNATDILYCSSKKLCPINLILLRVFSYLFNELPRLWSVEWYDD
jgi:hypothetical protein